MESIRSGGREKINHENCRAWLTSVLPKHSTQDFQKDKEKTDPLENFCEDNPEADECRVYED